jgi:hypothetical protein
LGLAALIFGEFNTYRRLARAYLGGVPAPAKVLAGGTGGASRRGAAVRIGIRCGALPAPGCNAERLTTGTATSAPTCVEFGSNLFEQLCNSKFKSTHAWWSQRECNLPLCKLIRCMHNAACAVTRTSRYK